jgi:hypothetical protein
MFVERTPRVRFDVMTQFGPIAILTSDAQRFDFADLREQRYMTGATCPKNIARLLGVPLTVDETARFLLGATPLIVAKTQSIAWNDDGFYRVVLRAGDGMHQELDFGVYASDVGLAADAQRLFLLRTELYSASGATIWRVSYAGHEARKADGKDVMVPFSVHVEGPKAKSDTLIKFKEIKLNPSIPAEAFVQSARPGMEIEEASCD